MPSNVIQGRFLGPAARPAHGVRPPGKTAQGAIQRHGAGVMPVDAAVLRVQGPGAALPPEVRLHMESAFGADFSSVRVHVGPQAERIGAIAFTSGADIYFAPGRYQPETPAGRRLLGHELAHVVQQRQGRVRNPAGGVAIVQDAALEAEADRMGDRAASAPLQMKPARPEPPKTHKLIVSESRHRGLNANRLAPEAASHSAVTLVRPSGARETFSFGPREHLAPNNAANVQRLRAGVPGAVRREAGAAPRPGAGVREIAITADQARAAEAAIRRQGAGTFRLGRDDCHGFVSSVTRAIRSPGSSSASRTLQRMEQSWETVTKKPRTKRGFTTHEKAERKVLFEAAGDMSSPLDFAKNLTARNTNSISLTVGVFETAKKLMTGTSGNKDELQKLGARTKTNRDARRNSITLYDEIHIENIHSGEYRDHLAVESNSDLTRDVMANSFTKLPPGGRLYFRVSGWPYMARDDKTGVVDIVGLARAAGFQSEKTIDEGPMNVRRNNSEELGLKDTTTYVFRKPTR